MSTIERAMPSRRTLLRTAAWTASAVSLAVSAPAFAAASPVPSAKLAVVSASITRGAQDRITVDVTIRNDGSAQTVALQARVLSPGTGLGTTASAPEGWTGGDTTGVWTASVQLAAGRTPKTFQLAFDPAPNSKKKATTVSVEFTTNGGTGAFTSTALPGN